ncbi:partial Calcium-transporting ATPase, partial [Patescibacteria group bacterium]
MNIEGLGWNQATKAIRVHGENLVPLAAKKQNDVFTQLSKVVTNRALVLRDGKKSWVDKSAVVPDDILFLKAGDIVCADSFVLEQDSLLVDESILVEGNAKEVTKKENLNLQRNSQDGIVYSGSYVVGGSAIVKVFATGKNIKYPRAAASNSISKYTGGIFSKVLKNTALKLSKHKV